MDELTPLRQLVVDEPMADESAGRSLRRLHEGQTSGAVDDSSPPEGQLTEGRQLARCGHGAFAREDASLLLPLSWSAGFWSRHFGLGVAS